jgi:integrase
MAQGQAKSQAKSSKTSIKPPKYRVSNGISIWSYKTKQGVRWACETRQIIDGELKKVQRRGFASKPVAMEAALSKESPQLNRELRQPLRPTFGSVFHEYIDSLFGSVAENTRANYFHLVTLYCEAGLFHKYIEGVTVDDIQSILHELATPERAIRIGTINTLRARLNGIFTFALKRGYVESNPVSLVRRLSAGDLRLSQVSEPWSPAEALAALKAFESTELDTFVRLALFLGLRKGEILALTWSDLDLRKKSVWITKSLSQRRHLEAGKVRSSEIVGPTKTNSSIRVLPLPADLCNYLATQMANVNAKSDTYVVNRNGSQYPIARLGKVFKSICQQNALRQIRIHDMRHTSAVLSLLGEAPLEAVSQSLGHTGIEVTKRFYAQRVSSFPIAFVAGIEAALQREKNLQLADLDD